MNKVYFHTLGCKLNFSESSYLSKQLEQSEYRRVYSEKEADIFVINTCSVTQEADRKLKYLINKIRRINPNSFISVIGCYAQLKPYEISQYDGVNLVLGADEKFSLKERLNAVKNRKITNLVYSCDINKVKNFEGSYSSEDRTRAFLKIQDGCDYKCTFCTIPLARGKSRSNTIENILSQVENIVSSGVKEIVLTGVNIGDFGKRGTRNYGYKNTFLELLEKIESTKDLERLRISSIEPNLLSSEIIELVNSSNKIMPHFHVPLQSGCDVLLQKMKRRYNTNMYREKISQIKKLMPKACIGVDVIVGFPGETDELFNETYEFIKSLSVSYLHVFTYSERSNTKAKYLDHKVPLQQRKGRSEILRQLSKRLKLKFYNKFKNKEVKVLFENENQKGYIFGYSEEYIRVKTYWNPYLANSIQKIKLHEICSIDNKAKGILLN